MTCIWNLNVLPARDRMIDVKRCSGDSRTFSFSRMILGRKTEQDGSVRIRGGSDDQNGREKRQYTCKYKTVGGIIHRRRRVGDGEGVRVPVHAGPQTQRVQRLSGDQTPAPLAIASRHMRCDWNGHRGFSGSTAKGESKTSIERDEKIP